MVCGILSVGGCATYNFAIIWAIRRLWGGSVERRVDAITVGVAATHLHIGLEYAMFLPLLVASSFKQEKT